MSGSETNGGAQKRDDELRIEDWIVVTSTSGQQYLGRLAGDEDRGLSPMAYRKAMSNIVGEARTLTLEVAFEFATPTTQSPRGDITRSAFVMSLGVTAHPARIHVRPASVCCCEDMHPDDRACYADLVRRGFQLLARSRTARSNIQLLGLGVKV